MAETITVEVPRRGVASDLTEALAARGLRGEIVDRDDVCELTVTFADDEKSRLVDASVAAIEQYLSERMLPFVVERGNGGAIVRPPAE
jgi:PhoPQ-activated pathogenicity-related protein